MSKSSRFFRVPNENETPIPPSHEVDLRSGNIEQQISTPLLSAEETGIRTVRVFDPQPQAGSNVLYYSVESKRVSSSGSIRRDCVHRRFSDFAWLRQELQRSFPGCVIPPLPTKSVLGTMQTGFIEKRQRGLNLFMERIIMHPRLRYCSSLDVFLAGQSTDLEVAKQERAGQESGLGASSTGLVNFFTQTIQSVQESIMGSVNQISKTESDLKFERMAGDISQSLNSANNCLSAFQGLTAASKEAAQWWTNFGLALTDLSQHERKQGHYDSSAFLNEAGASSTRTSALLSHHLEREYSGFKQPLRDLIDQLRSVVEALEARSNAFAAVQQAARDVTSKSSQLDKLRKRGAGGDKLLEAQDELAHARSIQEELSSTLQRVNEEIERDFDKFQSEQQIVLKRLAQSFAHIQITHNQKLLASWQSAVAAMNNQT